MDVVAEFFARTNAHDVEGLFELISADATYAEPLAGHVLDVAAWRDAVVATQALFSNRRMEIVRRRPGIDGEAVEARWTGTPAGMDEESFYDGTWVFDIEGDVITRLRGYY